MQATGGEGTPPTPPPLGTRNFMTPLTTARHLSLPCTTETKLHSLTRHFKKINFNVSPAHTSIFQKVSFLQVINRKFCKHFWSLPFMLHVHTAHLLSGVFTKHCLAHGTRSDAPITHNKIRAFYYSDKVFRLHPRASCRCPTCYFHDVSPHICFYPCKPGA
jgi:hypothetical protein